MEETVSMQEQFEHAIKTDNYQEAYKLLVSHQDYLKNYKTIELVILSKNFDLLFVCFWLDYPLFDIYHIKTLLMAGNHDCIRFILNNLVSSVNGILEENIIQFVVNIGDKTIADDVIKSNLNISKINPLIKESFKQLLVFDNISSKRRKLN